MLGFVLWSLWGKLKGPLKSLLSEKFSIVGGQLKALLASTIDDLAGAVHQGFFATDTWRHFAKAEVGKKGKQNVIELDLFPLGSITEATKIKDVLVTRLKKNVRLDAVRTEAGVADADWQKVLETYAADVQRLALPLAIKKMVRNEMPFYLEDNYVIDLAELEPIRIKGNAGHHTLVVLYSRPSYRGDAPSVAKAGKIWRHRTNDAYYYKLGEYDGFKAA